MDQLQSWRRSKTQKKREKKQKTKS